VFRNPRFWIIGFSYFAISYGLGAILVHWVTGISRDATGVYDHAFFISGVMAAIAVVLVCLVKKNASGHRKTL
jgi:biotin transporter BioY